MIRSTLLGLLLAASLLRAAAPVYVVLWFDTEDYIEPAADDAALRIATDLTAAGVRATFKVVGEKARMLEKRGRRDVIAALSRHTIGYHSNWHSVHPAAAEYLLHMGFVEGAHEFERREAQGVADLKRIFGVQPVCYGQPGSSWGPQSNPALRRLGIPVYLDEGEQVGVDEQPFWYGGLLHVYHMGRNTFRAQLNVGARDEAANHTFNEAAQRLSARGGGLISIYYHPTEFVTTEFWDAVNFAHGANPPREAWVKPRRRTAEESERCYGVLRQFVGHMKRQPGVQFVTAKDLLEIYERPARRAVDRKAVAARLKERIVFDDVQGQMMSPAEMLEALLGVDLATVDGPTAAATTSYSRASIPKAAFEVAAGDAAAFIRQTHRLPNQVFVGAETLSLPDFAATLAGHVLSAEPEVKVLPGRIEFGRYFATDPHKPFNWVIHPEGFTAGPLLDMARLQGWTLKPARLTLDAASSLR